MVSQVGFPSGLRRFLMEDEQSLCDSSIEHGWGLLTWDHTESSENLVNPLGFRSDTHIQKIKRLCLALSQEKTPVGLKFS